MTIIVRCPACNARLQVPEDKVGKPGRCPKCKQSIEIPCASHSGIPPSVADVASSPVTPSTSTPSPESVPLDPYKAAIEVLRVAAEKQQDVMRVAGVTGVLGGIVCGLIAYHAYDIPTVGACVIFMLVVTGIGLPADYLSKQVYFNTPTVRAADRMVASGPRPADFLSDLEVPDVTIGTQGMSKGHADHSRLFSELVAIGREPVDAGYSASGFLARDFGTGETKSPRAREIGQILYDSGGTAAMLEAHRFVRDQLGSLHAQELEACWGGVGGWMA